MFCLDFLFSYIFLISGFLLKMELSKDIPQEKVPFTKEKSILNDIAQETKELPGYGSLTEEELMEKVESILLERIKNGEKRAYFQLGLFYHEQVWMEIYCTAWVLHCTKMSMYYPGILSFYLCKQMNLYVHKKNRLKTSTVHIQRKSVRPKLINWWKRNSGLQMITNKLDVHVFQEVNIHVLLKAMCI